MINQGRWWISDVFGEFIEVKTSRPSNVTETRSSMNSASTTCSACSKSSALRSLLSFYFQKLLQHFSNPQTFILLLLLLLLLRLFLSFFLAFLLSCFLSTPLFVFLILGSLWRQWGATFRPDSVLAFGPYPISKTADYSTRFRVNRLGARRNIVPSISFQQSKRWLDSRWSDYVFGYIKMSISDIWFTGSVSIGFLLFGSCRCCIQRQVWIKQTQTKIQLKKNENNSNIWKLYRKEDRHNKSNEIKLTRNQEVNLLDTEIRMKFIEIQQWW